jgi:hypothetical protein
MKCGHCGCVRNIENSVVVVRVWRDSGRLIIRVVTSSGPTSPGREWVFTDVDAASDRVGQLLREPEE